MFRAYQIKLSKILRKMIPIKKMVSSKGVVIHPSSVIDNMRNDATLIRIGPNSHILGQLLLFAHGGEIEVGQDCFIGEDSKIWSAEKVTIGNRVLISHGVNIFDSLTHPINATKRHQQFLEIISSGHPESIDLDEAEVMINDDVWIGAMSIILKGVTIGEGAIIGAGSVVTKDVDAWSIVAGNPAKLIRKIPENER